MGTAAELLHATQDLPAPGIIIDEEALWANAADMVRRASGKPIRLATKSVRIRSIINNVLTLNNFSGVMTYSLAESIWLADHGVDDILLAYPTTDFEALRALVSDDRRLNSVTLMVDSIDHLELIDVALGKDHPTIRVCLDIDASLRIGRSHLGVRRSPVHTPREAKKLAAAITSRPGYDLVGLMFYDAQIAGMPDTSTAVSLVKRRSHAELTKRRAKISQSISAMTELEIVNGGGTGSLHLSTQDTSLTELTAGSGLFGPTLFDHYREFQPRPAAFFALPVVRKPTPTIATLYSGGFIASGPSGPDRSPTPIWPTGLRLLEHEGAGEVQTPVKGKAARQLAVGDRVLFRHAKAGELCERFTDAWVVRTDGVVVQTHTYRGEGKSFG